MLRRFALPLAAALIAATTSPVLAHHTFITYEKGKEMTLTGTVKSYEHVNPHARLEMLVTAGGAAGQWVIESESPIVLERAGITEDTLMPGERITVRVHPAKNGQMAGSLVSLRDSDGKVISLRKDTYGAVMMEG